MDWTATYGGGDYDKASSIQQTIDGGYIVAGETMSFGRGGLDVWVLKLSPDGAVDWQRTYGGVDWDRAYSVQQTVDGGYIVVGYTRSFGVNGDIWVLKLRPRGTVEWQKTYGGIDQDEAHSVQQTSNGGYIVAGMTASFGAGLMDIWVLKLRPDGAVEWQKTYGGVNQDEAHSIRQTRDGGYIVAGRTGSFGAGKDDIWVLKLKPDGSIGPSCNFIGNTNTSGRDSNSTILDTDASVRDSNIKPQNSSAVNRATNVPANILCH